MAKFNPLDYLKQATTKPQAGPTIAAAKNLPQNKLYDPRNTSGFSSGSVSNPMQPAPAQTYSGPTINNTQAPQAPQMTIGPSPQQPMQTQAPQQLGPTIQAANQLQQQQQQQPVQGQQPLSGKFDANGNPLYSAQGSQAFTDVNSALMGLGAIAAAPAAAVAFPALAPGAAAALSTQYNKVISSFQSLGKLGQVALSPGGPNAIAQTTVNNPAATRSATQFMADISMTKIPPSNTAIGWILKNGLKVVGAGIGFNILRDTVDKSETNYIDDSEVFKNKALLAGDYAKAEEIYQQNKELEKGLSEINDLIPFSSLWKKDLISKAIRQLNTMNNDWELNEAVNKVKATQVIVEDQKVRTAEESQLIQGMNGMSDEEIINNMEILTFLADPLNQGSTLEKLYYGAYNRYNNKIQQEEQRRYEESQKAEQRAYNEGQKQEQRAYDTANQPAPEVYSPASTLSVGILHTPGGSESVGTGSAGIPGPVGSGTTATGATGTSDTGTTAQQPDKDAIAIYLFQKHYVELSPEQKGVVDKW